MYICIFFASQNDFGVGKEANLYIFTYCKVLHKYLYMCLYMYRYITSTTALLDRPNTLLLSNYKRNL